MKRFLISTWLALFLIGHGLGNHAWALPVASISGPGILVTVGGDTVIGFQFTTNVALNVTHLGIFDENNDGLSETHHIGLWTDGGTLLASSTLSGGSGSLLDGFRYEPITPVNLAASETFRIAASYSARTFDHLDADSFPLDTHHFDSSITRLESASKPATGLEFPGVLGDIMLGNDAVDVLGPNFQAQPVPEPATVLLLGTGLVGLVGFRKKFKK